MALNSWVDVTRRVAAARGRLRGAIHELQGTGVRRALLRWRGVATVGLSKEQRIAGVVRSLRPQGRAMRRALNSWAPLGRQRALLRRAGAAVYNRGLRAAVNTWAEFAAEREGALSLMTRAAAALTNRGLRTAFTPWSTGAAERAAALERLRRSAVSLRYRGLRSAVNGWVEAARERACGARHLPRCRRRGARCGVLQQLGPLGRQRALLRRAGTALRQRGLLAAVNSWSAAVAARAEALDDESRAPH